MKKTKIAILIALILIISLYAFYNYKINVFDQNTVVNVDIRTGDFTTAHMFQLTDKEAVDLFNSLSSLYKANDVSDEMLESSTEFKMTLLNRWDLSKTYQVYITEDFQIFAKVNNEATLYQLDDVNFFMSHPGFDALYSASVFPEMSIAMDNVIVSGEIKNRSWAFKRQNGLWADVTTTDLLSEAPVASIAELDASLGIITDVTPTESFLKITDSNSSKVVYEGAVNPRQLPFPEYDGSFVYDLYLKWDAPNVDYRGSANVSIPVEVALPEIINLSKSTVMQGELIQISAQHVDNTDAITVEQTLVPTFNWYQTENGLRGYIPTSYSTEPGIYTIQFKNTTNGNTYVYEIEVVTRSFRQQVFSVDPNVQASTQNTEAYEEYRRIFNPVRKVSHTERYYTEPFILPSQGKLTTEFGESRVVNGEPTNYRHTGIDIAAPEGTEVVATNSGKVVLATDMILLGKIVIIDHGEGLFSVVQHMDSITVSLGDMVTRGEQVGTVGSTGFSSGAHLHFMISYYEINLEPGFLLYGEAITKENYLEIMK